MRCLVENISRSSLIFSGNLVSSIQEDNTHGQYIAKERELLEQDQFRMLINITFVGNETVWMVSTNDSTTPIDGLPNEILEKNILFRGGVIIYRFFVS